MGVKIKRSKLRKTTTEVVADTITLPKNKTTPSERLFDYVMLLYGEKKIGKTSLCSELAGGDAFFLPFESGTKALSVYQPIDSKGRGKTLTDWGEFKQYVKLICKDKRFPLVVVDPVDKAFKCCLAWVCKNMGIDHPSDEKWGKGWEAVREEFTLVMDKLMASGKGVIFISHAAEKKITTRTGDEYDIITATMPGMARDVMEGVVDIWAYYRYDGKERSLTILGDDHIGAGHRIKRHFRYTDGKRVRNISMGSSETEAAENLIKAFENKLENPKGGTEKKKVRIGKR